MKKLSIRGFICLGLLNCGMAAGMQINYIDDFTYQLQNYTAGLSTIRDSRFDLAVIDYSSDGMASGEWTAAQIDDLRMNGPCHDRIVLAYMSIGEAEDYRFYWNPDWVDSSGDPIPGVAPDWLGPTNPDWEGNYKVRYWMSGWQDIILGTPSGPDKSYLDRIIDAGFDGVYMDIIDAFEFWGPLEIDGNNERRTAARDMVEFVSAISNYARNTRGKAGFIVVPQNGAPIIDPEAYPDASDPEAEAAANQTAYFNAIDAIGAEDVFFGGDQDENNPYNPDSYIIDLLRQYRNGGKPVLSIEYLTQSSPIESYYTGYAPGQEFIPYATVRELDQMTVNNGFEPDCEESECSQLGVGILMPSDHYQMGDPCGCNVQICVPDQSSLQSYRLFVVLEVAGYYYCAPDFSGFSYYSPDLGIGLNTQEVIPPFTWPDTSGSPFQAVWYAGLTDASITRLEGDMDSFGFAWN